MCLRAPSSSGHLSNDDNLLLVVLVLVLVLVAASVVVAVAVSAVVGPPVAYMKAQ
jgi:hypothetical protein